MRPCFIRLKPVLAVSVHVGQNLQTVAKSPELKGGHHGVALLTVDRVCCLAGGGGGTCHPFPRPRS